MIQKPGQDTQVIKESMIARHSNRSLADRIETDDTAVGRVRGVRSPLQGLDLFACGTDGHIVHRIWDEVNAQQLKSLSWRCDCAPPPIFGGANQYLDLPYVNCTPTLSNPAILCFLSRLQNTNHSVHLSVAKSTAKSILERQTL